MAVKRSTAARKVGPQANDPLVEGRLARGGEPTYQQLVRSLRGRLLAGVWAEGEPLPSVRVLGAREGVSLATVQRAYDILVDEGLLRAAPGKAYFAVSLSGAERRIAALAALHTDLAPAIEDAVTAGLPESEVRRLLGELFERAQGGKPTRQVVLEGRGMGSVRGQRRRRAR